MSWEACYVALFEAQAWVVKGYLEQYGVPCVIEGPRHAVGALWSGALGEIRVLVREDWVHIARGLLRGCERRARPRFRVLRGGKA